MWALINDDNSINEIIRFPKALEIEGIKHPKGIFKTWTWEQLNAINIYTVEDSGTKGDDKFQITSQPTYTFNQSKKKVTTSYTSTDKALEDANAVDDDGNNVLDADGNQVINFGLKTIWVKKIKERAYNKLRETDWYVTRKTEGIDIPESVTEQRTAIRTDCKTIEDKIIACNTMTAFKKLFIVPTDDDGNQTGNAPIDDWTV